MNVLPTIRNNTKVQYITVVFIVLTLLVVGFDLMHSYIRNYSFYLSESVLFSTFWLIFIPLVLFCKKMPKRKYDIVLPVVFSLFHLGFFAFLVYTLSNLFFDDAFEFYKTFINTTSDYGLVCLIIYSLSTFLFRRNEAESIELVSTEISRRIKVTHQQKTVILAYKDILYVKSEKPYIAIVTEERTYLHHSSLKNFLKEQSANFIQIHKSSIVNTDWIVSYTSRKNGDYDIQLKNQQVVRASRSFNKNFKPFFDSISLK